MTPSEKPISKLDATDAAYSERDRLEAVRREALSPGSTQPPIYVGSVRRRDRPALNSAEPDSRTAAGLDALIRARRAARPPE